MFSTRTNDLRVGIIFSVPAAQGRFLFVWQFLQPWVFTLSR